MVVDSKHHLHISVDCVARMEFAMKKKEERKMGKYYEILYEHDIQPLMINDINNITFGPMVIVLAPTKVIFNKPATIVFWNDGSKTVVKCSEDDVFDTYRGFTMAYLKKTMGSGRKAEKFVDDNEFEEVDEFSWFDTLVELIDIKKRYNEAKKEESE